MAEAVIENKQPVALNYNIHIADKVWCEMDKINNLFNKADSAIVLLIQSRLILAKYAFSQNFDIY